MTPLELEVEDDREWNTIETNLQVELAFEDESYSWETVPWEDRRALQHGKSQKTILDYFTVIRSDTKIEQDVRRHQNAVTRWQFDNWEYLNPIVTTFIEDDDDDDDDDDDTVQLNNSTVKTSPS